VVEALDDDAIFGNEDEEEEGAFVMGNFADAFGEDFLGLRELGIAAEHGLSNLSIPKRLLKGKGKGENKLLSSAASPAEPPPPFPPPPPFILLSSDKVEDQIGLLRPYYQSRINALASPAHFPLAVPPAFGSNVVGPYQYAQGINNAPPNPPINPQPIILPDDPPNLSQMKMGPLGQIIKGGPLGGGAKKKTKRKETPAPSFNSDLANVVPESQPSVSVGFPPAESTPKKKKGVGAGTGGGTGNKKAKLGEAFPPAVMASA